MSAYAMPDIMLETAYIISVWSLSFQNSQHRKYNSEIQHKKYNTMACEWGEKSEGTQEGQLFQTFPGGYTTSSCKAWRSITRRDNDGIQYMLLQSVAFWYIVKNPPAMQGTQEMQVWSLGWDYPLE